MSGDKTKGTEALWDNQSNRIEWATRQLLANMLRVMRDNGKEWDLLDQMFELHAALLAVPPSSTLGQLARS